MKKPVALQLYTLREQAAKDFVGVLKNVSAIGYKGVEPAGLYGMPPKEFLKIIKDLGMVVCSNHGPWPNRENLKEVVDVANGLETKIVVSGFGPDDFKTEEVIRKTAATVNFMVPQLKAAGLRLALHNHYWEFDVVNGRLAYDRLMELCPDVWCELDVYWASNFGACKAAEQVAKNKKRTPLLHIKDGSQKKDQPMTAVGAGTVDIPACIKAADPEVLEWLIVELDACATDMLEAVRQSYRYLVGQGLGLGNK